MDNTEVFFGILRALGVDAHKGTPEVPFTGESGDKQ
jgi:alkaline phosphatase